MLLSQKGLANATSASSKAAAAVTSQAATALNSTRAGLSREPVEAEQAAELLQTAEGRLSLNLMPRNAALLR